MNPSSMLRLFIALEVPPALAPLLANEQQMLDIDHPPVRWVRAGGFHLTLQFLGDVELERVEALSAAVSRAAAGAAPFELELSGLGCFPNVRRPRVIWVGLRGGVEALMALQASVIEATRALGFEAEARPFSPHLTLGRVRERAERRAVARLGEAVAGRPFAPGEVWPVASVKLIRSELLPGGPRYTVLCDAVLGEAAYAASGDAGPAASREATTMGTEVPPDHGDGG
jgi:2'-5' RNA ligase